jgi:glucose-6-phosphate isomerase
VSTIFPNINPKQCLSYKKLAESARKWDSLTISDAFAADDNRLEYLTFLWNDWYFDFSKNRIDREGFDLLMKWAEECGLEASIQAMFSGEAINRTEGRPVLHTALRTPPHQKVLVDGECVIPEVHRVLNRMRVFCDEVHSGHRKGFSGKPFAHVVNIGIGGSDLGPVMVTEALKAYADKGITVHFVSNVDGVHLVETLKHLDPASTLFLVASKTFTTQETMSNAQSARDWLVAAAGTKEAVSKHFVALSTNLSAVAEFGIDADCVFGFWDWVGGRYSLWSAIGLSIALSIGFDRFQNLLDGAHEMDQHFANTPFPNNLPVVGAMLGIWYHEFFDSHAHAVIPYDQYLHRLPAYLQQADMESNGKSIDRNGLPIDYHTGPIIWGEPGTNGQHAFFQLLHQGTRLIPVDFIAPANSLQELGQHHSMLLANFLAQPQALMLGKSEHQVRAEFERTGKPESEWKTWVPYKVFKGNRPSNVFLSKQMGPRTLGQLVAYYEHRIFVQGVIWNVFSFDQWGVELGKQLANRLLPSLSGSQGPSELDASTQALLNRILEWRAR